MVVVRPTYAALSPAGIPGCLQSGKVLRFFCVWDDRGGLFGDRRPYVVHYYLEDDTVEINEVKGHAGSHTRRRRVAMLCFGQPV